MRLPRIWGAVCRERLRSSRAAPGRQARPPVGDALCAPRPLCSRFHVYLCPPTPPRTPPTPQFSVASCPEKGKPDKRGCCSPFVGGRLGCVWGDIGIRPAPPKLSPACRGFDLAGSLLTCHPFFFPKGGRVPASRLSALPLCLEGLQFFFFNLINFLVSSFDFSFPKV